jgi:hypothetical protein
MEDPRDPDPGLSLHVQRLLTLTLQDGRQMGEQACGLTLGTAGRVMLVAAPRCPTILRGKNE